jgi:hypothetical protein
MERDRDMTDFLTCAGYGQPPELAAAEGTLPLALDVRDLAELMAATDGHPWRSGLYLHQLRMDIERGLLPVHRTSAPPEGPNISEQMREAFTLHYIRAADCRAYFASLGMPYHPPAGSPLAKWLERAEEAHQGEGATPETLTPMKRAAIIERLGRRYPALTSALDRPEEWAKACRVPGRSGWYCLERIEAECRARYGGAAPVPAADLSPAGQLRSIGRR